MTNRSSLIVKETCWVKHVGSLFLAEIYLLHKISQYEQRIIGLALDNFYLRSTDKGEKMLKFPS